MKSKKINKNNNQNIHPLMRQTYKGTNIQTQRYNVKRDQLGWNQTKQTNKMWKGPKSIAFTATVIVPVRGWYFMYVCSIYKIKGMSHFNIAHTHATISVALKALSLSFSLSGCSDLSPNPTDIPALPERGTTTLMHRNLD